MGLNGNVTTADSTGSSRKLFTGVTALKILAVNPSQEQLKTFGYKADKAPVYFDDKNGRRVSFIVEGRNGEEKITTNVTFFLKKEKVADVWVDKFGKFGKDKTKLSGDVKNPYKGELDLLSFLKAFLNPKKDQEFFMSKVKALVETGDTAEIREILKAYPENVFKGLLFVREGKYQDIYSRAFERGFSDSYEFIHKSLKDNEKYLKGDFGPIDLKLYTKSQFTLAEYKKDGAMADATTASTSKASESTAAAAGDAPNANEEESPF